MKRLMFTACLVTTAAYAQTPTTVATTPETIVTTDAAAKTVKVNFVAGHGNHNNGLNYNGDAKGDKTLTVPLGWTVEVTLSNAGRMPHDVAVISGTSIPTDIWGARLAFPNAATKVIAPNGAAETVKFTANRPGTFLVVCRVGRHAQGGMFVKMTVTNGIKAPTYK